MSKEELEKNIKEISLNFDVSLTDQSLEVVFPCAETIHSKMVHVKNLNILCNMFMKFTIVIYSNTLLKYYK